MGAGAAEAAARREGEGAGELPPGDVEQAQPVSERASKSRSSVRFIFSENPFPGARGNPNARSGPSIPGPRHFLARALEKHLARRKANCYH